MRQGLAPTSRISLVQLIRLVYLIIVAAQLAESASKGGCISARVPSPESWTQEKIFATSCDERLGAIQLHNGHPLYTRSFARCERNCQQTKGCSVFVTAIPETTAGREKPMTQNFSTLSSLCVLYEHCNSTTLAAHDGTRGGGRRWAYTLNSKCPRGKSATQIATPPPTHPPRLNEAAQKYFLLKKSTSAYTMGNTFGLRYDVVVAAFLDARVKGVRCVVGSGSTAADMLGCFKKHVDDELVAAVKSHCQHNIRVHVLHETCQSFLAKSMAVALQDYLVGDESFNPRQISTIVTSVYNLVMGKRGTNKVGAEAFSNAMSTAINQTMCVNDYTLNAAGVYDGGPCHGSDKLNCKDALSAEACCK